MNVALVGFGKMGKEVLSVLSESGDKVTAIVDPYSNDKEVTEIVLNKKSLEKSDVIIDFSSPLSIIKNIEFYASNGLKAVIGTTGWNDKTEEVKTWAEMGKAKILYSSNFSIGVALFSLIVRKASSLISNSGLYDVSLYESHHVGKVDSPSGTALTLAKIVMEETPSKTKLLCGNSEGKIKKEELQITSQRVGYEPGLHEVIFDSASDTILLKHHARSRKGFAYGAVKAASWLLNTDKQGLLTMDDFLDSLIKER